LIRTDLCLAYADAGVEPIDFPIAPTVALPIALEKANLTVKDITRFEINEAFSVVVRIAEKVLGLDPAKVNPDGYIYPDLDQRILANDDMQWCRRSRSRDRKLRLADNCFNDSWSQSG